MLRIKNREYGINSFGLRILGLVAMILGLDGQRLGYGFDQRESFMWTALTIFAFLLAEGVKHTSDKRLYIRRFFVFTVLSEPCFDLYYRGKFIVKPYFSLMCTLFLCLLSFMLLEFIKDKLDNVFVDIACILILGYTCYYLAGRFNFAMGGIAALICFTFYVASNVTYPRILETIVLIYICFFLASESVGTVSIFGLQYPLAPQIFSFIALPFIWNCNGERGPNSLLMRILYYCFYPCSLIAFYLIKYGM